ncbi:serine protease [Pseudonocardia humida]|uniref:Serine protease n=1 Tax=Pseudonocardia humida TaxID=2800819 RepID=A0ABT0ZX67_9PSEU|nr:serine protease [Pseudonocardia humida]MCO1655219.1 serine protease [Pseudonocardia humida]
MVGLRTTATGVAAAVAVVAALVAAAAPGPAATAAGTVAAGAVPAPVPAAVTAPARSGPPAPSAPTPGPQWAPVADAAIRPGVLTETAGGGLCTSNFVFAGGGRTYLGQAAHCAGTGADTEIDGCTAATLPLGTRVTIRAADGTRRAGTLAYSSWVAMQAGGETDPAACAGNDFALVELAPADVADVNPSAPFFGGPTGLHTGGLAAGAEVFGYGSPRARIGSGASAPLRPKVGAAAGPAPPPPPPPRAPPGPPPAPRGVGDSGAGYLDADGRAVGLLSTLTLNSAEGVSDGLTDLAAALGYAAANGGLGGVELVLGTEPFTATPPGVPLTAIAPPAGPGVGG